MSDGAVEGGYRANCEDCETLDGSTRYELFAERDRYADKHERETGHRVERDPESPALLADGGTDHYREICKAMRSDLLITVNDSGGARGPESPELRVVSANDDGKVLLEGPNDTTYWIRHDSPDGTVLERLNVDNAYSGDETFIETIEVIGVGG